MRENRKKFMPALFIVLLAPALGELLSGSSPPEEYFSPFTFITLTILYGGGALLIREARARWNLGWSVILLAIAYGIIEEGIMVQSFFNHHHPDLGNLSFYSRWLGVNWTWTIMLTVFHATVSTLVPIAASDLLFPKYAHKPLLNKPGIIITSGLLILDVILFAIYIIIVFGSYENPYTMNPIHLIACFAITAFLIYSSYLLKDKKKTERKHKIKSPFVFFVAVMIFQWLNLFVPYVMAEFNVNALLTVGVQILLIILALVFTSRQIYNSGFTYKNRLSAVIGTVFAFAILAIIRMSDTSHFSMTVTGFLFLIMTAVFSFLVLRKNKNYPKDNISKA